MTARKTRTFSPGAQRVDFPVSCAGCGESLTGEPFEDVRPTAAGVWVHYKPDLRCFRAAQVASARPERSENIFPNASPTYGRFSASVRVPLPSDHMMREAKNRR
jgi:hypothetical protein